MNIPSITYKVAIGSFTLLVLGAIGVRFHWYSFPVGSLIFSLAGLLSFISICASAFFTRRTQNAAGRRQLSQAALIAIPAIIFFSISLFTDTNAPLIYDISTDTENPPAFIATNQQRRTSDNSLAYAAGNREFQEQTYPDIQPIPTLLSVTAAQDKARAIAESLNWHVDYQESGHIEATMSSFWFGITDDIVIRIRETPSGSIIDLRSASRIGKGDLDANASRIRQFSQQYLE